MKYRNRFFSIAVCLFFIMTIVPSFASQNSNRKKTVRVGLALSVGYHTLNADKTVSGFGYTYEQTLAQFANWNIEYVQGNWTELQEMLENGEIDILGFLVKTKERENLYNFAKKSTGISMSCLLTEKNNFSLSYKDYEKFNGITIAYQSSNANIKTFTNYAKENNFTFKALECESYTDVYNALDQGLADAALLTNFQNISNYKVIDQFLAVDFYYAVTKGRNELLDELNAAIEIIGIYYPNYSSKLYQQYYDDKNGRAIAFDSEEIEYLSKKPIVNVLPGGRSIPFENYNEKTQSYEGIVPDILKKISNLTGIKFVYIKAKNRWDFSTEDVTGNIITSITSDVNWGKQRKIFITQPFMKSAISFITDSKTNISSIALLHDRYINQLVQNLNPEWKIYYYENAMQCLDAVKKGKCDATAFNEYEAKYFLSMKKYMKLTETFFPNVNQDIGFGVLAKDGEALIGIIAKSLLLISTEEYSTIIHKNTSKPIPITLTYLAYTHPVETIIISISIIILLAIIIFLALYTFYIKEQRLKLNTALIQAEEANAAKTIFLSRMSHDMRTPLNSIMNYTRFIKETKKNSEIKSFAEKILISGNYLEMLINDTLGMSRIESGKIELSLEPYNYEEFIAGIKNVVEPRAKEKGVNLKIIEPNSESMYVLLDKLRIQEVFINIINNAIKFTNPGGFVLLETKRLNQTSEGELLQFIITDSGIGISKEFLPHLFEPFQQEKQTQDTEETGTGLGLSIAKRLIDLMGGKIECESELGKGTKFTIEIPVKIANEKDVQAKNNIQKNARENALDNLKGKHILLSEDHPMNTEIAVFLLQKVGCIVETAKNGKEAFMLYQADTKSEIDLILMDIRMPVMDGIEATQNIRAIENKTKRKHIPIIAMTANVYDEDLKIYKEAGMDGHVSKPINPKLLYETMEKLM